MESADVIPFNGSRSLVSQEELTVAVQLWQFDRDLSEALTREEIGAMKMLDRLDAQRKTLLIGFATYLRKHPRSDVAMGVYLVLTLLSDNDRGLATVSQPTLAKLFGRSISSIADAQRRLKEDGMIVMNRGRYAGSYPVIPRVVTQQYNHLTWIVGALASDEKPVNLPVRPDDCQSTGPAGGMDQSSCGAGGLKPVNHPVEPVPIIRPDPMQFQYRNSKEERASGVMGKVAAIAATLSATVLPAAAAVPPQEQVMQDVAECWQNQKARYEAATNIHEMRAQKQIWMTPLGVLEVAGDFKAELEREFPLVDLKLGLAGAATNVRIGEGAIRATQSVRRAFSYRQGDAAEKQKHMASRPKFASSSSDSSYSLSGKYIGKTL